MSRPFTVAVAALALLAIPIAARAQERGGPDPFILSALLSAALVQPVAAEAVLPPQRFAPTAHPFESRRASGSALLSSLYVSTALMQGLDLHSTYRALGRGAVEANPLVSGMTHNPAALVATKAAMATVTILAAKTVAKKNRMAAIVTLVALNSVYAVVVDHNYRVARGLR